MKKMILYTLGFTLSVSCFVIIIMACLHVWATQGGI